VSDLSTWVGFVSVLLAVVAMIASAIWSAAKVSAAVSLVNARVDANTRLLAEQLASLNRSVHELNQRLEGLAGQQRRADTRIARLEGRLEAGRGAARSGGSTS